MRIEPFGPPVDDLRHGLLCATLLSPHYPKGKAPDPRDFMVRRPPDLEMTPQQTEEMLDVLFKVRPADRKTKKD